MRRPAAMRQTLQFLALMACGLLLAGVAMLVIQAITGISAASGGNLGFGSRSAAGIDYTSFGVGLAVGLTLAEIARLSWSDLPRRIVAWFIANRHNAKYLAFACASLAVLIYV
jgi:hypothetical protein